MDDQILADLARRLEPELPDAMQKIKHLACEEPFHEMCSEYADGVKCLRRVREGQKRIGEITELIEDLEREILRYLLEH